MTQYCEWEHMATDQPVEFCIDYFILILQFANLNVTSENITVIWLFLDQPLDGNLANLKSICTTVHKGFLRFP